MTGLSFSSSVSSICDAIDCSHVSARWPICFSCSCSPVSVVFQSLHMHEVSQKGAGDKDKSLAVKDQREKESAVQMVAVVVALAVVMQHDDL